MRKFIPCIIFCICVSSLTFSQVEEEVQVKLLEIWAKVTDGDNHLVTDLEPNDFEIYIDGKKMQVRCFDKTFYSPEDLASTENAGNSKASNRTFIFFFDLLNTTDSDIKFLKQEIVDFLQNYFVDGDEGMVFVLLPSTKLGVVQQMSANKEALIDVVNKMRGNSLLEARMRNNEKQLLNLLYMFGNSGGIVQSESARVANRSIQTVQQAQNMAQSFALFEENLCKLTLGSFVSIADYLSDSHYSGRLVMIYASGGFSLYPGQNYYDMVQKARENEGFSVTEDFAIRDHPDADFSREVKKVLGLLNRLNVTIYSLDAQGLLEKDQDVSKDSLQALQGMNNLTYAKTMQDSLVMVAQETGGLAYTGGQNYKKGLAEIASDMGQQYWLCSNIPNSNKPGSFHKVEVKVLRPGLKVRYRKSYVE